MSEQELEIVVTEVTEVTDGTLSFGDLAKGKGFTPIYDHILQKYGLHRARAYGLVARMDKRTDGYCWMTVPNMAKMLRMEKRNVQTYLRELVEAGELFKIERNSTQGITNIYTTSKQTYELLCRGGSVLSTPPGSVPSTSPLKHTTKRLYLTEETLSKKDTIYKALRENKVWPTPAKKLSKTVTLKELETALSKGLEGDVLVEFLRGNYQEPVKKGTGRRGGVYDPKLGEYANFWDMGRESDGEE